MKKHLKGIASNSNWLIPISLQPVGVNLCHFKLLIRPNIIHCLKVYAIGLQWNGSLKSEFVARLNSLNFKETYFEDEWNVYVLWREKLEKLSDEFKIIHVYSFACYLPWSVNRKERHPETVHFSAWSWPCPRLANQ